LYERTNKIVDPVTREDIGICSERVDYGKSVFVSDAVSKLRAKDDLVFITQQEVPDSVIRYQKVISLDASQMPKLGDERSSGITDIIRLNVDRLLQTMDDPEYNIDYVDSDDLSVEKLVAAKNYRVDVAFRYAVIDSDYSYEVTKLYQLVMDRNGIRKLMPLGNASSDAET